MIVDGRTTRLYDENILITHRFAYRDGRLLIRVLQNYHLAQLDPDPSHITLVLVTRVLVSVVLTFPLLSEQVRDGCCQQIS